MEPKVSVIVLSYNYGRWATECLESVRNQTLEHVELIVIDDGSTDGSREIISEWIRENWPSAICRLHEKNLGLAARANEGLALANGPYYQLFSTDDRMEPEKLATQVAILDANPHVALCYSDMWLIDADGRRSAETAVEWALRELCVPGCPVPRGGRVLDLVFKGTPFCAPSWLVRTDAARAVGGYDPRIYTDDVPLLFRLASRFELAYVDRPLVSWRRHGGNTSWHFSSTPDHRLGWCDLLVEIDGHDEVEDEWLREYRMRVRNLFVGNPRRDVLPHVRYLVRKDPSLKTWALRIAAEVGICGRPARELLRWRDSIMRISNRGQDPSAKAPS